MAKRKRKNDSASHGTQMALTIALVVIALVGGAMLLNSANRPAGVAGGPTATSTNPVVLVDQANAAYDARDYVRAIGLYEQAIVQRPNDPNVLTDLGTAYYYKQPSEPAKALSYYDRALQVDPKFPNALFNRGVVLGDGLRDYATAVKALNDFLKVVPTGDQAASARSMIKQFSEQAALGSQPAK